VLIAAAGKINEEATIKSRNKEVVGFINFFIAPNNTYGF